MSSYQPRRSIARGKWWQIKAAATDAAELLIYGDIGESWFGESVTAKSLVEQLQALTAAKTITVRINSFGGAVADGIAIHNALRRHGADIVVEVEGVAFSIASLIAMAGNTVRMGQGTLMMLHAPWGGALGNAEDMRRYAEVLDKFAEAMIGAYARRMGADRADEIRALLTDGIDHYFDPGEAIAAGLADEVTQSLAVAASFDLSRFRSLPAAAAAFNREVPMKDEKPTPPAAAAPAAEPKTPHPPAAETAEQAQARALRELGQRNADIRAAFKPFARREGVTELEADCLADAGISAEAASKKLLKHLGQDAEPLNSGLPRVEAGATDEGKRRGGMVLATLLRAGFRKDPDSGKDIVFDGANPYRGLTLREMARMSLRAAGRNPDGMDAIDVARTVLVRAAGGQSTSDFPVFLENALNKMVLAGFQAITPSYPLFCKIGSVTDFRPNRRIVPGMIANLDPVNEAGEYKNKNLPDGKKESIQAKRRGNIIEITPETIVNDDLGAVADTARGLGMAGPRTIDRAVFALLALNGGLGPVLADGSTLIHASRSNTGAGAPSVAVLAAMGQRMAQQKFPGDDAEIMDLQPSVAVANSIVGGEIDVVVNSQYDPDANSKLQRPNRVRGLVKAIAKTERMPASVFYLFADPSIAPVIEVVFLDGVQQVRVVQDENFRTGGLAWRGELNADCGAIDFRGVQYSTGV